MTERPTRSINKDDFTGNKRMQRGQLLRSEAAKEETRRAQSLGGGRKRRHEEMQGASSTASAVVVFDMEVPLTSAIEADAFDEMMMGPTEQELATVQSSEFTSSGITSSTTTMDEVYEKILDLLQYFQGFNILAGAKAIVDKQLICSVPFDDKLPLSSCAHCCSELVPQEEGSKRVWKTTMTKGSFSRSLFTIFHKHSMPKATQKEIVDLLRCGLPYSIRIPAPITVKSNRTIVEHGIDDYADFTAPDFLTFEACVQACCVFVGDYAERATCPHCNLPRYTQCGTCQAVGACNHISRRTAHRTLSYRPIIGLLTRLLARYPLFHKLCCFSNINAADDEDYVVDLLQGAVAQKQLAAMDKIYAAALRDDVIDASFTKINLLLAQFYDGIQVFSTRTIPTEPLILQILNLPPNLRGVIGVGSFILSIIALTRVSDFCERFIFRDCMVKELQRLQEGIPITCGDGRKYFLQARMVMHCLDTPAMTHLLRVQGKGSYTGCSLCRCFPATRRGDLNKVALYDHRRLLEYEHILRYYGQSQKCCPLGYYAMEKLPETDEDKNKLWKCHEYAPLSLDIASSPSDEKNFFEKWCLKSSRTVSKETYDSVKTFLKIPQGRKKFICYHDEFDVNEFDLLFGEFMYFAHCNYMEKIDYARIPNDQYLRDAAERAARDVQHVNGVLGIWDFARLRYADLQKHTCWDPFHVLKNIYENFSENITAKRLTQARSEWCHRTGCHPSLWRPSGNDKKGKPKYDVVYVIKEKDKNLADACMNCLVFPVGHTKTYAIKNPFSRSGNIMGHGKVAILSVFMDYMLRLTELPDQYKNAFAIFSSDISHLLSPIIQKSSVELLWKKILESIAIMEGVFPESEATYPKHQLLDLPKQLLEFGPVRGWWTFYGERALSQIKNHIPRGGQAYYKTAFEQYIVCESTHTERFYNAKASTSEGAEEIKEAENEENSAEEPQNIDCDDVDGEVQEQNNENGGNTTHNNTVQERFNTLEIVDCLSEYNGDYYYDAFGVRFDKVMRPNAPSVTLYDLQGIMDCLIREIERRSSSFKNALQHSPIFYLAHFYGRHVLGFRDSKVLMNFVSWMKDGVEEWVENHPGRISPTKMKDLSEEEIYQSFNEGKIFAECFAAGGELFKLDIEMYSRAVVLGATFRARGWECRDKQTKVFGENQKYGAQNAKYRPSNEQWNRLKGVWYQKKQYSSWCRINTWKISKQSMNVVSQSRVNTQNTFGMYYHNKNLQNREIASLYGQLNAFLVIKVPSDSIVNHMALASITCRIKRAEGGRLASLQNFSIIDANDLESFEPNVYFIPATQIVPTAIALAGYQIVEGQHKPIKLYNKGQSDDKDWVLPFTQDVSIDYLALVDVDRNSADSVFEYIRLNFGYRQHVVTPSGDPADAVALQFEGV